MACVLLLLGGCAGVPQGAFGRVLRVSDAIGGAEPALVYRCPPTTASTAEGQGLCAGSPVMPRRLAEGTIVLPGDVIRAGGSDVSLQVLGGRRIFMERGAEACIPAATGVLWGGSAKGPGDADGDEDEPDDTPRDGDEEPNALASVIQWLGRIFYGGDDTGVTLDQTEVRSTGTEFRVDVPPGSPVGPWQGRCAVGPSARAAAPTPGGTSARSTVAVIDGHVEVHEGGRVESLAARTRAELQRGEGCSSPEPAARSTGCVSSTEDALDDDDIIDGRRSLESEYTGWLSPFGVEAGFLSTRERDARLDQATTAPLVRLRMALVSLLLQRGSDPFGLGLFPGFAGYAHLLEVSASSVGEQSSAEGPETIASVGLASLRMDLHPMFGGRAEILVLRSRPRTQHRSLRLVENIYYVNLFGTGLSSSFRREALTLGAGVTLDYIDPGRVMRSASAGGARILGRAAVEASLTLTAEDIVQFQLDATWRPQLAADGAFEELQELDADARLSLLFPLPNLTLFALTARAQLTWMPRPYLLADGVANLAAESNLLLTLGAALYVDRPPY